MQYYVFFNIYPLDSVIYLLEAGTGSRGAKSTDLKFDVVGNGSLWKVVLSLRSIQYLELIIYFLRKNSRQFYNILLLYVTILHCSVCSGTLIVPSKPMFPLAVFFLTFPLNMLFIIIRSVNILVGPMYMKRRKLLLLRTFTYGHQGVLNNGCLRCPALIENIVLHEHEQSLGVFLSGDGSLNMPPFPRGLI